MGLTTYVFSKHALQEMERRDIHRVIIEAILNSPEQVVAGQENRTIYQSRSVQMPVDEGEVERVYLIRVVVDEQIDPPVVITVYRTSKIQKYWRAE